MGHCAVQRALCMVAVVLNDKELFIKIVLSHGCTLYTEYWVKYRVKAYIVQMMVYSLQCTVLACS